jgi:hypothetical protein
MARALRMSKQQLQDLVASARANSKLWAELRQREEELEAYYVANPAADPPTHQTQPSMAMLVHSIIEEKYGRGHGYATGHVIIAIRRELRTELGYTK